MHSRSSALFVLLLSAMVPGICPAQAPEKTDGLAAYAALFEEHHQSAAFSPALSLDEAERTALASNPQIELAARRVAIVQAHVPVAGALEDPSAMYRGWGVPLEKPWDFNSAQNMFSLSQALPGAGKRALRTGIAESDADMAKAQLAMVRLDIQVQVRKAFNDLLLADEEMRLHDEHISIARQAIEAARIKYTVGKVSQQDILKAQVALSRVAEQMIRVDQDAGLARARLNTLLGRDAAAPLNVRGEFPALSALPGIESLEDAALHSRPDLDEARKAAERSHKEQALARKNGAPDFTVSAGYMLMPSGSNTRNNYMIEGEMSLPWLNRRKHDAEIGEAAASATAQDAELAALRNSAFGEIQLALVEAQSAQKLAGFYTDQLRPQAEATLQSSVIAYENGKTDFLDLLDSQMTVIDIDLSWLQAMADFNTRLADLELATGAPLDQPQPATPEVKP